MKRMKMKWKQLLPAVLSMSLAAAPVCAYAGTSASQATKPYDEETQRRLEDNVMEYEEIERLIDTYNGTMKNLWGTYRKTKKDLPDMDEMKDQIQEGSDQLADAAAELQEMAEQFKGLLGWESPLLPTGMSVAPSAYAEMVYSSVLLSQQSEQILLSANQLTEVTPDMLKVQMIDSARAGLVSGAQSALIGYEKILLQKESMNATLELLNAVYQSTSRQAAAGMTTQSEVLSAKQNLDSVQAGLIALEANEVKIRQTLCTLLGWAYDASPEIPEIPMVDMARIDAMNLPVDTQTATENNFTLKYNRLSEGTFDKGTVELENLRRTMEAEKAEIASSMDNLYRSVIQARNEYYNTQSAFALEQAKMLLSDRKMALGMIGKLEYLQQKNAFETAKVNAKTAELSLLQAVETYDWAVKGSLALSQ